MKIKLVSLLVCSLLLVLSSVAEVPRFYGEEVVVTASRLPQLISKSPWNTSLITSQEVMSFKTVGEALRTVAGADLQANGSLGSLNSIRLRGSNPSRISVLVDGRKINSSLNGEFDLGDLLTSNVEKIEIVRGPVSALYGSDAVGGVINIITKSPSGARRNIQAKTGSFGLQQYIALVENENCLLSIDYLRSDGFRKNSDYLAKNVSGKIILPLGNWAFSLDAAYYEALKGLPNVPTIESDPTSASTPNDRQADKNLLASVKVKSENSELTIYQNMLDQKVDPYVWGASTNEVTQSGVDWQQDLETLAGKFLYGIEAREEKGTSSSGAYDKTIRNYALYLQDETQLSERCFISAGIRGDKHSIAGTSINPRVGLTFNTSEDTIIRASYGSAFRAPSFNNLFWAGSGNPNLKPERATAYELGIERRGGNGNFSRLSYYLSNSKDLITYDFINNAMSNIGEAAQEGIEFELERKLGADAKSFVNYSYQKATDNGTGKYLPYVALNKFNAGISMGGVGLWVKNVGERYTDLSNATKLPAYTTVDLKISRQVKEFNLDLSVENMFDESYSEVMGADLNTFAARKYPMPGRSYSIGVKWAF